MMLRFNNIKNGLMHAAFPPLKKYDMKRKNLQLKNKFKLKYRKKML